MMLLWKGVNRDTRGGARKLVPPIEATKRRARARALALDQLIFGTLNHMNHAGADKQDATPLTQTAHFCVNRKRVARVSPA